MTQVKDPLSPHAAKLIENEFRKQSQAEESLPLQSVPMTG